VAPVTRPRRKTTPRSYSGRIRMAARRMVTTKTAAAGVDPHSELTHGPASIHGLEFTLV